MSNRDQSGAIVGLKIRRAVMLTRLYSGMTEIIHCVVLPSNNMLLEASDGLCRMYQGDDII